MPIKYIFLNRQVLMAACAIELAQVGGSVGSQGDIEIARHLRATPFGRRRSTRPGSAPVPRGVDNNDGRRIKDRHVSPIPFAQQRAPTNRGSWPDRRSFFAPLRGAPTGRDRGRSGRARAGTSRRSVDAAEPARRRCRAPLHARRSQRGRARRASVPEREFAVAPLLRGA